MTPITQQLIKKPAFPGFSLIHSCSRLVFSKDLAKLRSMARITPNAGLGALRRKNVKYDLPKGLFDVITSRNFKYGVQHVKLRLMDQKAISGNSCFELKPFFYTSMSNSEVTLDSNQVLID